MEQAQKTSKSKVILAAILGGVLGVVIVLLMTCSSTGNSDKQALKILQQVSNEVNKSCPAQIDAVTVLKNTTALPPRILQYNYTVELPVGTDINTLKETLIPTVKKQIATQPTMKDLRNVKTTFVYSYDQADGTHLFDFEVTPADYQ